MTLHTTALSLFSSTIASGLGLAMTARAATGVMNGEGSSLALLGGLALLLLGSAAFIGVASRAVEGDKKMVKIVFGSFLAGLLSLWFWLVPAQTAVVTIACHYGNFGACETVAEGGGFGATVANSNDEFVIRQCESKGKAPYCRLAAARRLSHPGRFCTYIRPEDAFEVVEWCTPNIDGDQLVARR